MENKIFLGKYRVEFDAGGMPIELRRNASAVTCKAQDITSGREVALELVPAPPLNAEAREKIEADAVAAKQLNHVNIPVLYDFGFDFAFGHGDLIYVTEYFEGTTADAWITENGPMPVRAVLHVALQVVSALGAATFHLVVHRAIHPGNILIVPGQNAEGDWPFIKVLNFGRMLPRSKSGELRAIDKSAPFASPEQLKHGTVDFRSEIYSLGCALWSLLTGVSPFDASGMPIASTQMATAMKRFRGVPKKIRRLIAEMVSMDPDARPLDPTVMTQHLQDCLLHVERREEFARRFGIPVTWQRRRIARPRRGPILLRPIAAAALLLTLAALAALVLSPRYRPQTLWKKLAYREPIGVPIGIPDNSVAPADSPTQPNELNSSASASPSINETETARIAADESSGAASPAPPIVASANENAVTSSQSALPNEPVEQTNSHAVTETAEARVQAAPKIEPTAPAVASNEVVSANETAAPPASTESENASPNEPTKPIVADAESNSSAADTTAAAATPTTETKSEEPAQTEESPTVAANKVPRAELVEPPPSSRALKSESKSKRRRAAALAKANVPRGKVVEPPPPAEGPENPEQGSVTTDTPAVSSNDKIEGAPRAELIEPPPRWSSNASRKANESITKRTPGGKRRPPTIRAETDGAMVQLPSGAKVHARFVGRTRDGQWMLALPSRRVLVVPPPPGFSVR